MKEIFITRRNNECLSATVDDNLFDILSKSTWYISPVSDQLNYAISHENKKTIYMHRRVVEILNGRFLNRDEEVDHIDGNGLNNQYNNLRIVNRSQNQSNQRNHRDSKSKYIGVHYNKRYTNPYRVKLMLHGKNIHVNKGCDTEEDAAEIRDLLALKYFGEYAKLNFPNRREEFLQKLNSGYNPNENTRIYSSKYIGVTYNSKSRKWTATIYPEGKQLYIGLFNSEIEAAEHVDMANVLMLDDNVTLNFEEKRDEYRERLSSGYDRVMLNILRKRENKKNTVIDMMSFIK